MSWYSVACKNNAAFLGVAVVLILLCFILHVLCKSPTGADLIADPVARLSVEQSSFSAAVILFMVTMLILFACANGAAGRQ
jgi:hypothetical protein